MFEGSEWYDLTEESCVMSNLIRPTILL